MTCTYRRATIRFPKKVLGLASAILLASTLLHSYAAEQSGGQDEAELWDKVAYVRLQVATGYDLQGDSRKEGAFRARGRDDLLTSGDELDIAGDEKYLASEAYQLATKHWEKAAKGFRAVDELDKARDAMENADAAWEAAKRTLRQGIEIHKMAEEYYETANNLEKKTAVLGKVARNLELLIQMKR